MTGTGAAVLDAPGYVRALHACARCDEHGDTTDAREAYAAALGPAATRAVLGGGTGPLPLVAATVLRRKAADEWCLLRCLPPEDRALFLAVVRRGHDGPPGWCR